MDSERERQITGIFNSAIERKPDERSLYLDGACGTDESLRREVEALINSHESAGSFIDSPAYERGADLLSTERAGALVGRSFGQYRLVSLLGAGGMGEVYLAEDTRLDRRVALKVLPLHLTADQSQVGRFQQEARAASALNHPNIVTIHEINEADGTHYIATEYIEGMTLRTRLGRSGLTLFEALDIAVQVASALNAAHSAGVVHKFIVYLEMADDGNRSIMVRQTATGNTLTIVPPTKGNVLKKTSFSRDGNFVYYLFSDRTKPEALYQVASIGGVPKKLIDDCDSPAAVSPDGKKIAFVRGADRKSELIVANADGTGERVVASLLEDQFFEDDGLSWSPDAKTIACVATVGDEESVKLVGVDSETGAIRELSGKRWARLCRMVWMPDGASLAIIAMERLEEARTQVWRVSYPGGEASRITNDIQDRDPYSLGVTADGRTLICVTEEHLSRIETISASGDISRATQLSVGEANQEGLDGITQTPDGRIIFASFEGTQADLWVMNADGTNRKRLTSDSYWDGQPVVSPDGRYIVFASNRLIGGISSHLWRMDTDGSNLKQLTTRYAFAPSVSPDGRWVVYASVTPSQGTKLAKISIDGGDPVPVTDYNATNPCYSPDGQWIACFAIHDKATGRQYFGQAASNSWEYSTIPATGGRPVKQFDFPAFQYQHIAWTADSRYVSFIGTPPDPSNIWLQPIAGGEAHQLTNFKSDYIFHHSWTPDGRSLVLVRERETADVVLMKDTREVVRP
jgi:Tol biopolymer transport system component